MIGQISDTSIKLKRIFVEAKLPDALKPLQYLSHNIWWSWCNDAIELFRSIDSERWDALEYNPVALLSEVGAEKAQTLLNDEGFMERLNNVYARFEQYIAKKPSATAPKIAYFCMEYGLHISLRLYSGGLGVLAGDYLKEASDTNTNLTAVGLLYRYGYFKQSLSLNGDQLSNYDPQKFTQMPIDPVRAANGDWLKIGVEFPNRTVYAKVWRLNVGRIPLYLLDTDIDENQYEDRTLTYQLYGGDNEHRLKQEMILGIGGTRALVALGLTPNVFHCNEGHAAFSTLERLKGYIKNNHLSFEEAVEVVRASSLFTTHTPVPAGHDYFHESLLKSYLYKYTSDLHVDWSRIVALGKLNPSDFNELFSMSHLAMRLSQGVNGVSRLHGKVSQEMFQALYPGYHWSELYIHYVTNSVHYPTWVANIWHKLYATTFGENFLQHQANPAYWRKIHHVPNKHIMAIRRTLKVKLLDYVKKTIQTDLTKRGENPSAIFKTINAINDNALVLGFARRFATYKRAQLIFTNPERLAQIVNQADRPVLFIFAGKAHPADKGGQELIRNIVNLSKRPEFLGKVLFIENYNMEMAKFLVQGVDIWLNNPTRPLEASGTSGMKAIMNGVVNFSVLDGWWSEGYRADAGWALSEEPTYQDEKLQDQLDAENIYNILENEIIPTYYDKDEDGVSHRWAGYVKNTIAEIAPQFTMTRMLDDYFERYYTPQTKRAKTVNADDFKIAREMAAWKRHITNLWHDVHVVDKNSFNTENNALPLGESFSSDIKIYTNGIAANEIGVELVFFKRISDTKLDLLEAYELKLTRTEGSIATYTCHVPSTRAGVFEFGFRMFPKHKHLAHRQDLPLVKWV